MNILCIGESKCNVDLSVEENNKTEYILGMSLISSYLLGSWKENVYYQGLVGKDIYGSKIVKELKGVNVKIKYIEYNKEEDKERKELKYKEYKFIPEIIFSDGTSPKVVAKVFNQYTDAIKLIYAKSDNSDLLKTCKSSNYIIFPIEVAQKITNINFDVNNNDSLEEIYSKLKEMFGKIIIIDMEASGTVFEYSEKIKLMGKIKADTTYKKKNKDIFYGALIYGISNNLELDKCIRIASIAEYLSLKKTDVSIFIPELKDVYEIYAKNK